jgi:hypothetical protein
MCKLIWKSGGASEGPLLLAVILFFLLSATVCHAQVRPNEACAPPSPESITSVSPSTWSPGQTVNLVIQGNFSGDIPSLPGCYQNEDFV